MPLDLNATDALMSAIAMGRYLRQATHPTTQLMHGIAALFATRLVQSWLFEIGRTDPATFVLVAASLLALAIVASLIPAIREPIDTLRRGGFRVANDLYENVLRSAGELA